MKSRLTDKIVGPFIVQLFKRIRHFGMVRTVSNSYRRFNKKATFCYSEVIAQAIGIKDLKAIINLTPAFIYKMLPGTHHMNSGV